MGKTIKQWEVCVDLTFISDYAYIVVEAETEEEAMDKITEADVRQAAAECTPELDMWNVFGADFYDEYEKEDEE